MTLHRRRSRGGRGPGLFGAGAIAAAVWLAGAPSVADAGPVSSWAATQARFHRLEQAVEARQDRLEHYLQVREAWFTGVQHRATSRLEAIQAEMNKVLHAQARAGGSTVGVHAAAQTIAPTVHAAAQTLRPSVHAAAVHNTEARTALQLAAQLDANGRLPNTPLVQFLEARRALDPARFDFYHPTLGPLLAQDPPLTAAATKAPPLIAAAQVATAPPAPAASPAPQLSRPPIHPAAQQVPEPSTAAVALVMIGSAALARRAIQRRTA